MLRVDCTDMRGFMLTERLMEDSPVNPLLAVAPSRLPPTPPAAPAGRPRPPTPPRPPQPAPRPVVPPPAVARDPSEDFSLVFNLSSRILSRREEKILNLGLKFVPHSESPSLYDAYSALATNARRCRIRYYFDTEPVDSREEMEHGYFRDRSLWNPGPCKAAALERYLVALDVALLAPLEAAAHSGFSLAKEFRILSDLRRDPSVMVLKADKSAAFVIVDTSSYHAELRRQLSDAETYAVLSVSEDRCLRELCREVELFVTQLFHECPRLPAEFKATLLSGSRKLGCMYVLPKIHKQKPDLPMRCGGRPIVSMVGHPCERLSKWLHMLMAHTHTNAHAQTSARQFTTMILPRLRQDRW